MKHLIVAMKLANLANELLTFYTVLNGQLRIGIEGDRNTPKTGK